MAILDMSATTTTDLTNVVTDFGVTPKALDFAGAQKETPWDFPDAPKNLAYYFDIPELASACDSLSIWVAGKGFETDKLNEVILGKVRGWGEDSFQSIMMNMIVVKKIIGDAFCEIIRNDKGTLINLKPISPERVRLIINSMGMIERYDIKNSKGKYKPFETKDILHSCNKRMADQIHGTSIIDSCKWVIDARNEALTTMRMIKNRDKALGIAYYDTSDKGKIKYVNEQIEEAVKKGEMLGLPKDTIEIREFPSKNTGNILEWIRYLENFFYQIVGVPRVIATSEGVTEAGGKVGYLTFEPVYVSEQKLLEKDILNKLGIRIKFNRPASLGGTIQSDEAKNTGQLSFQPNDVQATMRRE